jgi:membrane-associated phospholipid phosphatase
LELFTFHYSLFTLISPDRFAKYISIICIPPTFATFVFSVLVLTYQDGDPLQRWLFWLVSVLCSGVLQMAYVLNLRRQGRVGDYDVPARLQRTKPYLISVGISFAGLLLFLLLHASFMICALMWCYCINTFITAGINLRWKISAHMMGLTGPLVFLYPILGAHILWFLPLALLLGWSRVRLKAHTPAQVFAGAIAGAALTLGQLEILMRYGSGIIW